MALAETTHCRCGACQILSGAVVAQGELDATVTAVGAETFFGKTISLLGAPQERGHLLKVLHIPCRDVRAATATSRVGAPYQAVLPATCYQQCLY